MAQQQRAGAAVQEAGEAVGGLGVGGHRRVSKVATKPHDQTVGVGGVVKGVGVGAGGLRLQDWRRVLVVGRA